MRKRIPLRTVLLCALLGALHGGDGFAAPVSAGPEGSEWQLVEVGGIPVSPAAGEQRPFLKFDAAKKEATGHAGCNRIFGGYRLDGSSLKIGPLGSTRMSCPDLPLSLETEFLKALDRTRGWKIRDGELLFLDGGEVLARLAEKNAREIAGTAWRWVQTLYNDDRKAAPADPKDYTVQFREDGTLQAKADCNLKGGTYSSDGKLLSIEITHSTMAACPEGSLEDEFVRTLSAAAIYFLKDGDLYIDLKYDTGTMRFSRQQKES
jgi:heat shock protein HslJ